MKQICLEAMSRHMKVAGKRQHRFTKDKFCMVNLELILEGYNMPRDKGRKVDVYFDFSVVFDAVFYKHLKSNLERYGQTTR